jgi:putative NADPH-quinone reductase
MAATLVLLAHPDPARSRLNAALADAANTCEGVVVRRLHRQSPEDINLAIESAVVLAADRIVLQFPMQWYGAPAVLKDWIDTVLTHMVYVDKQLAEALRGRSLMAVVTCGAGPETYRADGRNLHTVEALLAPFHALAHRCGLRWEAPMVFHADAVESDKELAAACARYAGVLGPVRHDAQAVDADGQRMAA